MTAGTVSINDWDETARVGRCEKHNDLAWLHGDGSVTCMFCLTVEAPSVYCTVGALPAAWLEASVQDLNKSGAS